MYGLFRVVAWVPEVPEREAASILDWNAYLVYEILGESRTSVALYLLISHKGCRVWTGDSR